MSKVLFLFMDGVGLGSQDPAENPFARAEMPTIERLLQGRRLVADSAPFTGPEATLVEVDARLGVPGSPQSATGQAALLTGRNVPAEIGEHYGPKPNKAIAAILREGNLFKEILRRSGTANLINAYPPRYFEALDSGRRLHSSIQLAAVVAGLELMTVADLRSRKAMSVDFTGEGWRSQPDFPRAPVYAPAEAGSLLAQLSAGYDLCWFDYWLSDYAGHKRDMQQGVALLESFDAVLAGLLEGWRGRRDLILITSDHGNLEDMNRRGHTTNPVPALVIGPSEERLAFCDGLNDLTDFSTAILRAIFESEEAGTRAARDSTRAPRRAALGGRPDD